MVSSSVIEIIAATTVSFVLGWQCKSYHLNNLAKNFKNILNRSGKSPKLVIVVRSGLPMTKGKIAAQCAHAALACYKAGLDSCPDIVKEWEDCGQPKVILKSISTEEEEFKKLAKSALNEGLIAAFIRDAGRTQVHAGSLTALGIGPGCPNKIDGLVSNLKLL